MQAELAGKFPEVQETYAAASEALGYDLWGLVQEDASGRLDETVVTQPAMLTAGVAAWKVWHKAGGATPALLAGHSLGEYTALVCAGAFDFADAVRLVQRRAELMQSAVPAGTGAMAALLGLDDVAVMDVCARSANGQVVSAVNFNAPGQVVIAGEKAAVLRAIDAAKEAGAKRAIMLSVSVPSHCALMSEAAGRLAENLLACDIAAPSIPVIGNADVLPYASAEQIRAGLKRQLYSPVRWVETVNYFVANGASRLVESGPGKVLAGLAKRIDRSLPAACIETPESLALALTPAG
jgi:[acyl-carrier-protein] S-malonyltransferase